MNVNTTHLPNMALTAQEATLQGGSEFVVGARMGQPWTPLELLMVKASPSDKKDIMIGATGATKEELAEMRRRHRFFRTVTARMFTGREDAVLSLEPLNEDGETVRDPQICILDPKTGELTEDKELTKRYYTEIDAINREERAEHPDAPEWYTSTFLRDLSLIGEKEVSEPPEGMRNV